VIDPPEGGRPGRLFLGGHYEDVYARTPQGWRFKSRRFVNESQAALKAPTTRSASTAAAR
jgi:hypothetical protein